jgi:hypothetical protein
MSASQLYLGLRAPDARTFKGLVELLLRVDFPEEKFPGHLGLLFPKNLNASSFAEGFSTHVGPLVATNVITGYCVFEKKKTHTLSCTALEAKKTAAQSSLIPNERKILGWNHDLPAG